MSAERLQKILSAAGIASRRAAEQIILEGRVTVNGHKVKELGVKADITKDHVKVDGKLVRVAVARRYVLMNKPKGLIVTRDDPGGIPTVFELLKGRVGERVVAVGRLDVESEGLLILTDDGAARAQAHASLRRLPEGVRGQGLRRADARAAREAAHGASRCPTTARGRRPPTSSS